MTQAMAHALVGWVRPTAVTHQPAARLARAMPLASWWVTSGVVTSGVDTSGVDTSGVATSLRS